MYLPLMQGVKYILLIGIFGLSTAIGFLISKSYQNRVIELKEFKNILNIMKTKIKFTYEPLAEIFKQISKENQTSIEKIFGQMANQLTYNQAKDVWEDCIQNADISIKQEDKDILKKLINRYTYKKPHRIPCSCLTNLPISHVWGLRVRNLPTAPRRMHPEGSRPDFETFA